MYLDMGKWYVCGRWITKARKATKINAQEAVHIRFIDHISNVKIVTPRNKMSKAQVAMLSALMRAKR